MEFECQDLREYGVVLIPPSSPAYDPLLESVRHRLEYPVKGSPPYTEAMKDRIYDEDRATSAILVNRSRSAIASIQWIRKYQESSGRVAQSVSGPGMSQSIILPFGMPERSLKVAGYWNTILPGSARYVSPAGAVLGDNSDVRPPRGDEIWPGKGVMKWGANARNMLRPEIVKITLILDGVFFVNGGFAGPNAGKMWEQVTASADAHQQVSRIARMGRERRSAPQQILADIQNVTGVWTDRPPILFPARMTDPGAFRKAALDQAGWELAIRQRQRGDEEAVQMAVDWAAAPVPHFVRLSPPPK